LSAIWLTTRPRSQSTPAPFLPYSRTCPLTPPSIQDCQNPQQEIEDTHEDVEQASEQQQRTRHRSGCHGIIENAVTAMPRSTPRKPDIQEVVKTEGRNRTNEDACSHRGRSGKLFLARGCHSAEDLRNAGSASRSAAKGVGCGEVLERRVVTDLGRTVVICSESEYQAAKRENREPDGGFPRADVTP